MVKKLLLILAIGTFLTACSQRETELKTIQEVSAEVKVDQIASQIFLEPKAESDVKLFQKAVKTANKVPGIVNMGSANYKFKLGDDLYFMWLSEESGSLMNAKDTHSLYAMTVGSSREIWKYVSEN